MTFGVEVLPLTQMLRWALGIGGALSTAAAALLLLGPSLGLPGWTSHPPGHDGAPVQLPAEPAPALSAARVLGSPGPLGSRFAPPTASAVAAGPFAVAGPVTGGGGTGAARRNPTVSVGPSAPQVSRPPSNQAPAASTPTSSTPAPAPTAPAPSAPAPSTPAAPPASTGNGSTGVVTASLPPGIAKKAESGKALPPGQAKKLAAYKEPAPAAAAVPQAAAPVEQA